MTEFDKYLYYQQSVQSPETDAEFLETTYHELKGHKPHILREDFCAAFALCCEWVKRSNDMKAIGVDLDPEPISYGETHYKSKLSEDQQNRLSIIEGDVLKPDLPKADVIAALNFSYFGFKRRPQLLAYMKSCYDSLLKDGILVMDCFGGPSCMEPNEHETEHEDFSYYWDQDTYNPVTNHAMFYIHFKLKKEKLRREKVFTYDWRLWSLTELQDLATEAGFSNSHIYWEGTDEHGEGSGEFSPTKTGELCDAWVAYLVAEK